MLNGDEPYYDDDYYDDDDDESQDTNDLNEEDEDEEEAISDNDNYQEMRVGGGGGGRRRVKAASSSQVMAAQMVSSRHNQHPLHPPTSLAANNATNFYLSSRNSRRANYHYPYRGVLSNRTNYVGKKSTMNMAQYHRTGVSGSGQSRAYKASYMQPSSSNNW